MRSSALPGVLRPLAILLLLAASAAAAPGTIGPNRCVGCHDHSRQASKWQREEPRQLGGRSHFGSLERLNSPRSAQFARAVGVGDPYEPRSSCVTCHATVFRGQPNAGVSCESCHGGSQAWVDLHQQKGARATAIGAGMRDLRGRPEAIAKVCVSCHVVADARLVQAGHPNGERFDAGTNLGKIVHWTATYDFAQVSAAGRAAAGRRAAAKPAARAPAAGKTAPPTGAPAAEPPPPAPGAAPLEEDPPAEPGPALFPPPPSDPGSPAPRAAWDWDRPRPLPKDFAASPPPVPAPVAPEPARRRRQPEGPSLPSLAPEPALPSERVAEPAPEPAPEYVPVPPTIDATPAPPVFPRSLLEESPLLRRLPGEVPRVAPRRPAPSPSTPGADLVELRGRGILLLERLLRGGGTVTGPAHQAPPAHFEGPDSELLRLQDEVTSLLLEALRRKGS